MDSVEYIMLESERQSATAKEYVGMMNALVYLRAWRGPLTDVTVQTMGGFINGQHFWRRQPVFFRSGGHAVNWQVVPKAMDNLIAGINEPGIFDARVVDGMPSGITVQEYTVDYFTKEFLDIHPFVDGNGRVASLLRNWMLGTLDNPSTLPYYYDE